MLIRGNAGGRLPIIVVAAILGAWAGDALGDRLGFDVLASIGDFHLLAASIVAWVGIAIVTSSPSSAQRSGARERRPDGRQFLRGLTIGAIIGAIIAGSSIWTRRRRSAARSDAPPAKPADGPAREAPSPD